VPTPDVWAAAVLAATAAHVAFQLTVTVLVYPALAEVTAASWVEVHARHSRRIVPLVGLVYLAVLVTTSGSLVVRTGAANVVSAVASAVVLVLTACFAAPLHGRLTGERDPRLLRRLLHTDRLRSIFTVVAFSAALVAAFG